MEPGRSSSEREGDRTGRRVAAPHKPRVGGLSVTLIGGIRAAISRGPGLTNEEPAATYSPRGLPPKYHRRKEA